MFSLLVLPPSWASWVGKLDQTRSAKFWQVTTRSTREFNYASERACELLQPIKFITSYHSKFPTAKVTEKMRFREQYVMSVEQHHSTLYMYFPTKESYVYQRDLTNRVIIKSLAQIEFRIAALDQLTSHIEKQKQKRCLSVVTDGRAEGITQNVSCPSWHFHRLSHADGKLNLPWQRTRELGKL